MATWPAAVEGFDDAPNTKYTRAAFEVGDYVFWPYQSDMIKMSHNNTTVGSNWKKVLMIPEQPNFLFKYLAKFDKFVPYYPTPVDFAATDWALVP